MSERFDAIVIGAGPGGEVAVVECELIGGESDYWACMPSRTLIRPAAVVAKE